MPREEINLQLTTILNQLTKISSDTEEIKKDLQKHTIKVVEIKKDIERIDKERAEDKEGNGKAIEIIHKSIQRRDKNNKWFVGIIVTISGIIVTIVSFFINRTP